MLNAGGWLDLPLLLIVTSFGGLRATLLVL
jgi:hypothetical protein